MMRVLTNKEKKLVQIQKTFYWYIFHMSSSISDIYFSEMHHLKKTKKRSNHWYIDPISYEGLFIKGFSNS